MKKIFETLQKKWAEYFLEMLVITFGIILALVLNDWRDQNVNDKKLLKLFEDVKDEITYDISELHPRIELNEWYILESSQIINNEYNWGNRPSSAINASFGSIVLSDNSYNELLKFSDQVPEEYDSIMLILNQVYGRWSKRIWITTEDIFYLRKQFHDQAKGYQWYDSITSGLPFNETAIEFYTYNTEFRNTYKLYNRKLTTLNYDLKNVYVRNIDLILRVKDILKDTTGLPDFIPSNDYTLSPEDKTEIRGTYLLADSSFIDEFNFYHDYLVQEGNLSYFKSLSKDLFVDIVWPDDTIKIIRRPDGQVDGLSFEDVFYQKALQN